MWDILFDCNFTAANESRTAGVRRPTVSFRAMIPRRERERAVALRACNRELPSANSRLLEKGLGRLVTHMHEIDTLQRQAEMRRL
jgi:hypothetical protein